ncbi:MAG: phosphoprotein [Fuyun tick rhabdovirus]|uniref:Phosphoprotein n=1 Tax=Fuyun tick rhabdovirus TaxID=2977134 RepID=A0A977R7S8_9RHAB|nr:MAG: phosphoprotein [Fuyun tick rhabdovirus]
MSELKESALLTPEEGRRQMINQGLPVEDLDLPGSYMQEYSEKMRDLGETIPLKGFTGPPDPNPPMVPPGENPEIQSPSTPKGPPRLAPKPALPQSAAAASKTDTPKEIGPMQKQLLRELATSSYFSEHGRSLVRANMMSAASPEDYSRGALDMINVLSYTPIQDAFNKLPATVSNLTTVVTDHVTKINNADKTFRSFMTVLKEEHKKQKNVQTGLESTSFQLDTLVTKLATAMTALDQKLTRIVQVSSHSSDEDITTTSEHSVPGSDRSQPTLPPSAHPLSWIIDKFALIMSSSKAEEFAKVVVEKGINVSHWSSTPPDRIKESVTQTAQFIVANYAKRS